MISTPTRYLSSLEYPRSYIAWDLETTGLDPKTDKILEIGALKVLDGHVTEVLHLMLNHNMEIPKEAAAIHGITREECERDGIDPVVALKTFLQFFQWDTAIAVDVAPNLTHNGFKFDLPFLSQAIRDSGQFLEYIPPLNQGCFDTAVLYKAKQLKMERWWHESFLDFAERVMSIHAYGVKFSVPHCCKELGIDTTNFKAHRALSDIQMTHNIYQRLMHAHETQGPDDYPRT